MKILVIGGGGREHAFVWKLKQSSRVEKIWCAPGNGGISNDAECVPVNSGDVPALVELANSLKPDLVVVGPELPLVLGLADSLRGLGFRVVGPGKSGAVLEGSKISAKRFMQAHGIPTAQLFGEFHSSRDAIVALDRVTWPVVIKADGLCAGKGVLVTSDRHEAEDFIHRLMDSVEFGDGGKGIILEEALSGAELSYIVLTDGERVVPFAPARDHKRLLDGDKGPNTGGMGAFSTDDLLNPQLRREIEENVVKPTIRGLREDGVNYRGFLYFGLMITAEGPKVLEYNCRMGDPETQAIMLRADFDLAEALLAAAEGDLSSIRPRWNPAASICVVAAAKGYPEKPVSGDEITGLGGLALSSRFAVFHAGTKREHGMYYTGGGRVLGISASSDLIENAIHTVYDACQIIAFDGMQFRADIARSARTTLQQSQHAKV